MVSPLTLIPGARPLTTTVSSILLSGSSLISRLSAPVVVVMVWPLKPRQETLMNKSLTDGDTATEKVPSSEEMAYPKRVLSGRQ